MSNNDPFRVIGIAGTTRSGSTLLTMLLGGAPNAFAAGETNRIWRYAPDEVRGTCWCEQPNCPFWTPEFLETCLRHTYRTVGAKALDMLGCGLTIVSDKRPQMYMRQMRKGDSLDGLVVIFKTPEEFLYSQYKRGVSYGDAAWQYRVIHRDALKLAKKIRVPMLFVEYSELASRTEEFLERICTAMGVKFSPDLCQVHPAAAVHMLGGSDTLRALVNSGTAVTVLPDDSWKTGLPDQLQRRVAGGSELRRIYEKLRNRAEQL